MAALTFVSLCGLPVCMCVCRELHVELEWFGTTAVDSTASWSRLFTSSSVLCMMSIRNPHTALSLFFFLLFLSSLFPSCRMHQARSWKGRAGSKVWGLLKIYRFILFIMLHTVQIYLYSRVNNRRCHKAALQGSSCSCPHSKWKYVEGKKKIVFGYPCETIRSSRSSK